MRGNSTVYQIYFLWPMVDFRPIATFSRGLPRPSSAKGRRSGTAQFIIPQNSTVFITLYCVSSHHRTILQIHKLIVLWGCKQKNCALRTQEHVCVRNLTNPVLGYPYPSWKDQSTVYSFIYAYVSSHNQDKLAIILFLHLSLTPDYGFGLNGQQFPVRVFQKVSVWDERKS